MQINLDNMTIMELKALAYDEGFKLEQARQNLSIINQVIQKKLVETPKVEEAKPCEN